MVNFKNLNKKQTNKKFKKIKIKIKKKKDRKIGGPNYE